MNVSKVRSEIASGKNVGDENGLTVRNFVGQLYETEEQAASDARGNHDAIAFGEIANARANLLDDTHAFVPQDGSRLHVRKRAANHVEIRAADGAGREVDKRVIGLLNPWLVDVVEANVADSVENDGFHSVFSLREFSAT